jgi:hypothetical protein
LETIELEENRKEKLLDIDLGSDFFFGYDPKCIGNKSKIHSKRKEINKE